MRCICIPVCMYVCRCQKTDSGVVPQFTVFETRPLTGLEMAIYTGLTAASPHV